MNNPDLKVSIRFVGPDRVLREQQIDTLVAASYKSWKPSRVWPPSIATRLFKELGLSDTDTITAWLVLDAENKAGNPWLVDDMFIDPWRNS